MRGNRVYRSRLLAASVAALVMAGVTATALAAEEPAAAPGVSFPADFASPIYVGSDPVYVPGATTTEPATTPPATTQPATTTTQPATTTTQATTTTTQPATTTTLGLPTGPLPNIASNFDATPWLATGERIPASSASEPSGAFRTFCGMSHLSYDDPIAYAGQVGGSPHLHMFFGNTGANAASTYASLRTTGLSTCQGGPLNRTGYWTPTLLDTANRVVAPEYMTIYYKGNGTQAGIGAIQNLPNGLRMIAGYGINSPNAIRAEWKCEGNGSSLTIPSCPAGQELEVWMRFPMCWDGKNVDSADHRSHMAYGTGGGGWFTAEGGCPPGYPVHLPEITEIIAFTSDGNTQNWWASSDRMSGMAQMPNGSTFHADWFGAWDNGVQQTYTQECIREMRTCVWGELGNGTRLINEPSVYTGPDRITPPARP